MDYNQVNQPYSSPPQATPQEKYCQHCGAKIPKDAVFCTYCGQQVAELRRTEPQPPAPPPTAQPIIINNTHVVTMGNAKNKWVALLLCIFTGWFGFHKFYEGKVGMGILYLLTFGLLGIGVLIDALTLLFKSNPYYV